MGSSRHHQKRGARGGPIQHQRQRRLSRHRRRTARRQHLPGQVTALRKDRWSSAKGIGGRLRPPTFFHAPGRCRSDRLPVQRQIAPNYRTRYRRRWRMGNVTQHVRIQEMTMRTKFAMLVFITVGMFAGHANAETALKFSLDFIMFGPNSPFVYADESGYFKEAGLAVRIDPSSGSGDAINRLASGAYDIGYADVSTLIEFAAKNPSSAPKIVLFIQDRTPSTILYRKQKHISKPKDLEGHSLGSGATDAGARMFPTFARLNNIDVGKVDRQLVDFRLRDSMFAQGNFDAIIAYADSMLNVRTLGLDISEIGRLDYADWGLNFYGNAMFASRQIIDNNPEAVRGAVQAVAKAWRDAARDQTPIIDALLKRNNLAKREVDLERLKFIVNNQVVSPFTRANGIGAVDQKKLGDNLKLVGEGFNLASVPSPADIFDDRFLPPVVARKFAD